MTYRLCSTVPVATRPWPVPGAARCPEVGRLTDLGADGHGEKGRSGRPATGPTYVGGPASEVTPRHHREPTTPDALHTDISGFAPTHPSTALEVRSGSA